MEPANAVVEFWFEFASTYTYPAAMRIEMLALARGIDLRWQPFLLGPIDIADPEVLAHCLAGLVEDPAATLNAAGDAETKARLRQNNERAAGLGIFGSPSLVVAGELFWGNDRLEAAFDWSEKSRSSATSP